MNRLRKLIELGGAGQRSGREAFVLRPETLPAAHAGFEWREDETFNAADAILDDPELKAAFSAAIKEGHVVLKRRPPSPG
jgi:hypothetical protein